MKLHFDERLMIKLQELYLEPEIAITEHFTTINRCIGQLDEFCMQMDLQIQTLEHEKGELKNNPKLFHLMVEEFLSNKVV